MCGFIFELTTDLITICNKIRVIFFILATYLFRHFSGWLFAIKTGRRIDLFNFQLFLDLVLTLTSAFYLTVYYEILEKSKVL